MGADALAFQDVAYQCVFQKDAEQMALLLAAHRQAFPWLKNLAVWDIEVLWLKKDYKAAVDAIVADRGVLLKNQSHRYKVEGHLVRSLIRLKRTDDAIREAEAITKRKDGTQMLLVLALAATGDVQRVLAHLEAKRNNRYLIEDCYRDEELGPILRSEAFRKVQERFPPPAVIHPANGRFDDDWD